MTEKKKFSNAKYGAGRLLEKRRRILKKLRVKRESIPEILERDEDNIVKIPEDADENLKKVLTKLRSDQRKALEAMKEQLVLLEEYEAEIGEYGFNINDSFNGIETASTLSPAGTPVA
jgi:hypothetical protein